LGWPSSGLRLRVQAGISVTALLGSLLEKEASINLFLYFYVYIHRYSDLLGHVRSCDRLLVRSDPDRAVYSP
jgi:hypothetical protein